MSSRTKEALIAKHEIQKRKNAKYKFSLGAAPSSTTLLLIVAGIFFIVLPFLIPEVGQGFWKSRITTAVRNQELANDVHSGQFRASHRSGDTTPNEEATFWGVSILKKAGAALRNEANTQTYVQQRHEKQFQNDTRNIYRGIVLLKSLGLTDNTAISGKIADNYYALVLKLHEEHSGFRLSNAFSASAEGTYYAFEAIKELGKFETFKNTNEFSSAINFVVGLKDSETKGFKNTGSENATLSATWYAVQVLTNRDPKETELVANALSGVDSFIYSTQTNEGGFLDKPVSSTDDVYHVHASLSSTVQAIWILQTLTKFNLINSYARHYDGLSYLRSHLSLRSGLERTHEGQTGLDLEGAFHFLRLVETFPSVGYSIPRILQLTLVSVGVLLILAALYQWVTPQLPKGATRELKSVLTYTSGFLVAGAIVLQVAPSLAVIVYVALAVYLTIQFYEVSLTDYTDGMMVMVAGSHIFATLVAVLLLLAFSPVTFAHLRAFYIVGLYEVLLTFVVTLVACHVSGVRKLSFFVSSGFLGWIGSTIVFYSVLYGKGDMGVVYRMINIHGHFPLIFVVLPIATLIASYGMSAYAAFSYFQYVEKEEEPKKEAKKEDTKLLIDSKDKTESEESKSEQ